MSEPLRLLIAVPPIFLEQFVGEAMIEELHGAFDTIVRIDPTGMPADEWRKQFAAARPDALLSGWVTPHIPADAIPPLKIAAHTAGGVRQLVSRDMIEHGLMVTNWGPLASRTVAEHALTLTLATLRRLPEWAFRMRDPNGWKDHRNETAQTLYNKRVSIHGFGVIARELIRLLKPFDCDITVYSAGVPNDFIAQHGVKQAGSLEELFPRADVFIEVEALTDVSRDSVTAALLEQLPAGAAFINVGRGLVVDETALGRLAAAGKIYVGLDVFRVEPPPADSLLWGQLNVMLTPHIAGPTVDERRRCGRRAVEALKQFARGQRPEGVLTLDVYDRST